VSAVWYYPADGRGHKEGCIAELVGRMIALMDVPLGV
jgi:hypothetical protein